ncbi:MAG: hypothetical protein IKT58_01385 [Oscillospiraceae bacterium]|nr:hypothetical protein [Oscillospiraceae bacterium]
MRKTMTMAWILFAMTVLFTACGNRSNVSEDANGMITDNLPNDSNSIIETEDTGRTTAPTVETNPESSMPGRNRKQTGDERRGTMDPEHDPDIRHRKPGMKDANKF